jgi:beta-phosphoglucomutase-like phosphatase (HAD superfamily)
MRDPTRREIRPHERQAALDLVVMMESRRLVGLINDQVRHEFDEHAQAVQEESERALTRLREQLANIDDLAGVFGATGRTDLAHLADHVTRARTVVDRWMAASMSVPEPAQIASRALGRLNQARTPARKGKDSMKDCVVIESYLDLVTALRNAGLSSRIVFVSSNTEDYASESHARLKPDLEAEFSAIDLEYAPNLAAAKHLLRV